MPPMRRKRIEDKLVQWGYLRHRVEKMDDFRLKICYSSELAKRNNLMYDHVPYTVKKILHPM